MTKLRTSSPDLRSLSEALSEFPGLNVLEVRQETEWAIYLRPQPERLADGYASLEFLIWFCHSAWQGEPIAAEVNAPPPYLNGPGASLYFVIRSTAPASDVAALIRRRREQLFFLADTAG